MFKKRHNSKKHYFQNNAHCLQHLPLVMMSKYSKFHVDIFDSFQTNTLNKQFWKVEKGHNSKYITFRIFKQVFKVFHVHIFDSFQIIILNKQFW